MLDTTESSVPVIVRKQARRAVASGRHRYFQELGNLARVPKWQIGIRNARVVGSIPISAI
jgi:hypothetical protein